MTAEHSPAPPSHHLALANLVSFFDNAFAQEPTEQVPLLDVLERIRAGIWGASVNKLRRMVERQDEKGYQDAKRHLPAFAMSGACLTRDAQVRLQEKFLSHSCVLQCDFDRKDNPHLVLAEIVPLLTADPHVLFGFVSPSGVGLKAGVVIDGTRHAESFASAERYFLDKYGLQIDRSTKDPLRLCFVSSDEDLWINHAATELPVTTVAVRAQETWHPPIESTAEDIREMLKHIPPRPEYGDWIRIASAVWSALSLEDGCRLLAEWSPEEKAGEYASKHRHRLAQIGVGTLVHYAAANGFDARAAARRKQWAGRIRFSDTPRTDAHHEAASFTDPAADVRHVDISREFILECFESAQFGDATLWAALVRGKKLFDHLAQSWRTYKAGVWEKDDTAQTMIEATTQIAGAYDEFAKSIRAEIAANPPPDGMKDPRQKMLGMVDARQKQIRSTGWLSSVLTFSEGLLASKATQFDKRPHLLCLSNGVIDFESGTFREHRPADMLTVRAHLHFDPEADCPKWKAFLTFAMGEDREMIAYLARAVGYSLTGYVDKDVLFFLFGKGANGKSTFTSVLKMLGGEFMTTIGIEALLTKQSDNNFDYKKAMLEGKRIVVTDEIPQNRTLGDSAVKSLVGGDEITARRPYERPYTFEPTHKLWLVGNHKPEIKGVDLGIWRRIHLVPWTVTIPEEKRRPRHEVLAELRAELPGILNWAIRGYLDMMEGGLKPPGPVVASTKEYQQDSDQFARFFDERLQLEKGTDTMNKDIHSAYLAWCEDNGEEVLYRTSNKVALHLKDVGIEIIQKGQRNRYAVGVRLLSSS